MIARPARIVSDRPRIAFIHDNDAFGGIETLQLEILRHLDRRRFDPTVVLVGTNSEGTRRFTEQLTAAGVDHLSVHDGRGTGLATARRIARALRSADIDIAHLQTRTPLASRTVTAACALARVRGLVRTEHVSPGPHTGTWTKLSRLPFDLLTDVVMTDSDGDRRQQIELVGRPPHKVVTSHCGIDTSDLDPDHDVAAAKVAIGLHPDVTVIGTVGRLHRQKGHRYLVDAVPRLIDGSPRPFILLLVGDGPDHEVLQARVTELGIDDVVRFAGHQIDPLAYMRAMDIATMPSLWEGFSICMQQFMALGKPMVVSDHHSFREAITDLVHGLIVPMADSDALGAALLELLRDDALAARLGRSASERAHREFGIERHVADLMRTYDRVLSRRTSAKETRP